MALIFFFWSIVICRFWSFFVAGFFRLSIFFFSLAFFSTFMAGRTFLRHLRCRSTARGFRWWNPNSSCCKHPQIFQAHQPITHSSYHVIHAVVFIRDYSIDSAFKVGEKWKPNSSTGRIVRHQRCVVGQCVVVQEESGSDVESHEDVNWVMLVCGKNEEDAEHIQHPCGGVEEVEVARSVWKVKKFVNICSCFSTFILFYSLPAKVEEIRDCHHIYSHSVMKKLSNVKATVWPENM